jgi:hypothetical protein
MLLDRASRFIWELSCGEKDQELFMKAIKTLVSVIDPSIPNRSATVLI